MPKLSKAKEFAWLRRVLSHAEARNREAPLDRMGRARKSDPLTRFRTTNSVVAPTTP